MKLLKTTLIALMLILGVSAFPQLIQRKFKPINATNGLSHNAVEDIIQDSKGFIWLATADGLNRYDGNEFRIFKPEQEDSSGLSYNHITSLYEDKKGNIWMGTLWGGINRFNPETEIFDHFLLSEKNLTSQYSIGDICEDENGNIYAASSNGLIRISPDDEESVFLPILNINEVEANYITSLYYDSYGKLLLGANEKIYEFDTKNEIFKLLLQLPPNEFNFSNISNCIIEPNSNQLYIGTSLGLLIYNRSEDEIQTKTNFSPNIHSQHLIEIKDIVFENSNIVWLATNIGVIHWDISENIFQMHQANKDNPYSLKHNAISNLFIDNSNMLWITITNNGIATLNLEPKKFHHYLTSNYSDENKKTDNIYCLFKDYNGNYWIATSDYGIYIIKPTGEKIAHITKTNSNQPFTDFLYIRYIYEDNNNNLWLCSSNTGLIRLNQKINNISNYHDLSFTSYHPKNNISNNTYYSIRCITQDENNHYWIGTADNGLVKMDIIDLNSTNQLKFTRIDKYYSSVKFIKNLSVWEIESRNNEIWFAGGSIGLYCLKYDINNPSDYTIKSYKNNLKNRNSLSHNKVRNIHYDNFDRLWVGTEGGGLNLYQPKSDDFIVYKETDGLSNNIIFGITSDLSGQLWLSTNNGISNFNPKKNNFFNYYAEDGIQSNSHNFYATHQAFDGEILMGGNNGFTCFFPSEITQSTFVPNIVFTKLMVFENLITPACKENQKHKVLDKAIGYTQKIVLNPKTNFFQISFAALQMDNPDRIKYKYLLQGYHNKWISLEKGKNFASFNNLPAGKYILKVKATNTDGKWSPQAAILQIVVKPPFWKTFWFLGVVLFVGLAILFLLMRYREKTLFREKKKLEKLINKRTIQLQNKNEELEHYQGHLEEIIKKRTADLVYEKERAERADRLKTAFLSNMSHEIRTPLNSIVGFSNLLTDPETTIAEKNDYAKYITNSSSSLQQIINDIIDISRIESNQMKITISPCNLTELMCEIQEIFIEKQKNIFKKDITLKINTYKVLNQPIYTDIVRLKQILTNLLDNAFKFTTEGNIELNYQVIENENQLLFWVKDSGIGIPVDQHEEIFNRFSKLEILEVKSEGTGLGLAICKKLAKLLEGDIWVESLLNQGATFKLNIPLKHSESEGKYYESSIQVKTTPKSKIASDGIILVVEDEENNYKYINEALTKNGFALQWITNGTEAIEACEKLKDKLIMVLMDLQLPGISGYEAARQIRGKYSTLPIIAQTAYAMPGDREKSIEAGCNDYIAKPYKTDELIALIKLYLDNK